MHPTVLLVDDHADVCDAFARLLRAARYAVETARNGREALQRMRASKPCIILLDLMMPDMNGYDFRQAQIADETLRDIPVVLFSASPHIRKAAKELNAVAIAEKPINAQQLLALVSEHCLK